METKAYTFIDIFSSKYNINRIIIPMIQRDYAQGRDNKEAKRVRKNFLEALYRGIIEKPIVLDFVYGDISDGVMTPLDGQQRLTTLFLLHWYAAKKENIEKSEYEFLKNFSYETRFSTRDFCAHLIDFNPEFFSLKSTLSKDSILSQKGIISRNNVLSQKEISGYQTLSQEIEDQKWFALSWKKDPSISSMLVMIDAIDKRFRDIPNIWERLKKGAISFYFLGIDEMGLTDELYIKMNSRGKPLTPFEHFKAEFERVLKRFDEEQKLYGNHRNYINDENDRNSGKKTEEGYAQRIIRKIDREWTDMLWKYHSDENIDYIVDRGFLCYFRFICDLISYIDGSTPGKRSDDEFDILNLYFSINEGYEESFSPVKENTCDNYNDNTTSQRNILNEVELKKKMAYIERNIEFLESAFDAWEFIKTKEESLGFFSSYISNGEDTDNNESLNNLTDEKNNIDKVNIHDNINIKIHNSYQHQKIKISKNSNIDIFEDCLTNYADVFGNRKRKFELRKIILLFSFLVYLLNRDKISDGDFRERLRIINNLINNSGPEINERENRMTRILNQTKSIILYGFEKEISEVGFNNIQMEEEKEKYIWRRKNPNLIESLNRIEDHHLLHGQIGVIGLDHPEYFSRFETLFNCNWDLVDCALMATGFYPKEENYWRSQFGSSEIESAWENLFHGNIADNTKNIVRTLLSKGDYGHNYKTSCEVKSETQEILSIKYQDKRSGIYDNFKFTDEILKEIADSYIKECEDSDFYDFRYYYIKYPSFRPGRYGKYYRFFYGYSVIWAQHRISENSYNPFLKEMFESNEFKEYVKEKKLKAELFKDFILIDRVKVEISEEGFIFRDFESDEELEKLSIKKSDKIGEDFPLQNIKKADREDRIKVFNQVKDEIFTKLNIFKI